VRTPAAYRWLADYLTVERLRELMVEARELGSIASNSRTCWR